ncbi:DUF6049 family protein [Sinosporangium siamense]|uniref:Secreted protein n=1 Tax=Sinosporangium siamense TaxID=1367973 RepID=A0A919RQG6_9ACTN|nr:DUF6049 family protein [Sinosporangium siamense]GII97160.1 hypothetical protein Ssi02_73910 [Sinosporangium siamense]
MIRLTASLALLSAAMFAPPAAAAVAVGTKSPQAHLGASAQARQTTQLIVESITPDVPRRQTDEIKIKGTIVNGAQTALSNVRVRLRYAPQAFTDRTQMENYQIGQGVFDRASVNAMTQFPQISPGGKSSFEFTVTPAGLRLWGFGVYPMAVEVVDAVGQQLAIQRTYLPYAPENTPLQRTKLALVLPVIDQPRRADDGNFASEGLRPAMTGSGRLADLLKIAQDTGDAKGVTWFVDPALLDDARAMSQPYRLKNSKGTQDRQAEPLAKPWLDGMRTALAEATVMATPYADPDIAALTHNGLDGAPATALRLGGEVASEILGREVGTSVNWPVGGMVDHDTLDVLAGGEVSTVLLNPDNVPYTQPTFTPSPTPATPHAATGLNSVFGPVKGIVTDKTLSGLLEPEEGAAGATVLNRQRFIAETAMITKEQADKSRAVVAAPARRWANPDPAFVTDLVKTVSSLPWISPVKLDSIKVDKSSPVPRADLTYSEQDRRGELSKKYLESVRQVTNQANLTTVVTSDDDKQVFDRALLRLTSSAWRGRTALAGTLVKQVDAAVDSRIGKVKVTGRDQRRTLAGNNGVVPISIRNETEQTVMLDVDVRSKTPDLLAIEAYGEARQTIGKGQSGIVSVPMRAKRDNGDATVIVQLRTIDGEPYGEPVEIVVRTTGYTGIALVIVGGGLVVMLAAVLLRVLRRRSQKRLARLGTRGDARSEARARS